MRTSTVESIDKGPRTGAGVLTSAFNCEWNACDASLEEDRVDLRQLVPCAPEAQRTCTGKLWKPLPASSGRFTQAGNGYCAWQGDRLMYFPAPRLHHASVADAHHTTGMLRTAEHILAAYPFLSGDLREAGVILHDLCKIPEMKSDSLGNVSDYAGWTAHWTSGTRRCDAAGGAECWRGREKLSFCWSI